MKIVIAPDSFKECLSASEVAKNVEIGIKKVLKHAATIKIPVSDGGEGLLEALITPLKGKLISVPVKDPLFRNIDVNYGLLSDGTTAVIEMATASGLELLKEHEKNPLITTTYGTGMLIKDALDKGCTKIIIGMGGSATNDGGSGMISALGGKFLDNQGNEIQLGGGYLDQMHSIDLSNFDNRLLKCEIIGACDVSNPLTGEKGSSFVFGGQKGGKHEDLIQLDKNLDHYAAIIRSSLGIEVDTIAGAGAAGGMGAALLGFFNANLQRGIDLIMETLQLEREIRNADLVITGEGKIDDQTLYGKTIAGIACVAKKNKVPVVVITGKMEDNIESLYQMGITSIFSIVNKPMTLEESISNAPELIQTTVENIVRSLQPTSLKTKI